MICKHPHADGGAPFMVACDQARRANGPLLWCGPRLPTVGERVNVSCVTPNVEGVVVGYFTRDIFVGVRVKPDNIPDPDHTFATNKEHTEYRVFAPEVRIASDATAGLLWQLTHEWIDSANDYQENDRGSDAAQLYECARRARELVGDIK